MKTNAVLELLRGMPEDVDTEDLMYRLYLRQKLEASEAALQAGDVLSHQEVVRRSEVWLK